MLLCGVCLCVAYIWYVGMQRLIIKNKDYGNFIFCVFVFGGCFDVLVFL